jgi:hypothetical protein
MQATIQYNASHNAMQATMQRNAIESVAEQNSGRDWE